MISVPARFGTRRALTRRRRQILRVAARHGFNWLLKRGAGGTPGVAPEQLRGALEELGATFIKLGQVLSTRSDLLGPEYLKELAKLQDAAPAVPDAAIKQVVALELGMTAEPAFVRFESQPLAAASIGQVHAATITAGGVETDVVVKVQRPGVSQQANQDIEILESLAAALTRRIPATQEYDLVGLAQHFGATLRGELDYVREGRNAERFAQNFADDETVHIPRVYWEKTTERVLTLERMRGIKVDDDAALDAAGIDRKRLARRAVDIALRMVFEHGFFHADLHPGNFFIEADGRIAALDFGMVGTIDEITRARLSRALIAISHHSGAELADCLLELLDASSPVDRAALSSELDDMLFRYRNLSLGEISLSAAIEECFAILRRHHLRMPANLALLLKTMIMAEGLGVRLDPDFRLIEEMMPYAQQLMQTEYSPSFWAPKIGKSAVETARLTTEFPRQLRRVLNVVDRGYVEFELRPESLAPFVDRLERMTNRLVLGILAAAFIVGLAVLTLIYHPAGWEHRAGAAFAMGFGIAAILGGHLALTILRQERG